MTPIHGCIFSFVLPNLSLPFLPYFLFPLWPIPCESYSTFMTHPIIPVGGQCHNSCITPIVLWPWWTDGPLFFCLFPALIPLLPFPLFPTRTILLWLMLVDSCCTIMTHPRTPALGPGGVRWLMDLFCDSSLFTLVHYRLCIFNYKYRVVAVVRPQSCLRPLLAIQVLPSHPLSLLSYYALLWTTEPLNHWALVSTAFTLTSSIPRPCKVLT